MVFDMQIANYIYRATKQRLRKITIVPENQFGFVSERLIEAIFLPR